MPQVAELDDDIEVVIDPSVDLRTHEPLVLAMSAAINASEPECPEDVRHQCNLRGRFFMPAWAEGSSIPPRPLSCRIHRLSPFSVTVAAPCRAEKGQQVVLGVEGLEEMGALSGRVTRAIGALLTVELEMDPWARVRLFKKISWMERRKTYHLADNRRSNRFYPRNTHSRLVFADGVTLPCDIIDLSTTGAALNADVVPMEGEVLAVGKIVSRVVRHLELGFAVQFIHPVARDVVEAMATVSEDEIAA